MIEQKFKPKTRSFLAEAQAFSAGQSTPRHFLEYSLEIASDIEADLHAFVFLDADGARRQADASSKRWREGRQLSPVDGLPVGIKDVIETIDMPTGMGSPLFTDWRSDRDAACVYALREAGAVIVGKTVTTEFAATEPGPTRNPWDLERTPGGSSSGSAAAVGAGILSAALGTQVIGSVIRPAGYCGCVGFKPTIGALNRGGSHDYMSQSCLGVIGASLEDTWQVAHEIVQRCGGDPGAPALDGPDRLPSPLQPASLALIETAGWADASEEAKSRLEQLLERLTGAGVRIRRRTSLSLLDEVEQAIIGSLRLSQIINAWESRWPLNTYAQRDKEKLSQAMQRRLTEAEAMTLTDYKAALEKRALIRILYSRLATDCEACITLSAPGVAPRGIASTGNPVFAVPASMLGVPALSLPLLEEQGMPLGVQLIGFAGQEAKLMSIAAWLRDLN